MYQNYYKIIKKLTHVNEHYQWAIVFGPIEANPYSRTRLWQWSFWCLSKVTTNKPRIRL